MFRRVVSYTGFWKSVLFLSGMYLLLFLVVQWVFTGFSPKFIAVLLQSNKLWMLPFVGFSAGFFVSYGKFWAKIKKKSK